MEEVVKGRPASGITMIINAMAEDESTFQALLTQANDLEVGEAIDVPNTPIVGALRDALIILYPERTFFLRPSRTDPASVELSRVMYVERYG